MKKILKSSEPSALIRDAKRYKLRYKITGSSTWTTVTNISPVSKTISGLSAGTSYTWQAKSVCSAKPVVSSDWSSKQTFTTSEFRIGNGAQQVSFQIYPNPAVDHANIQFTLPPHSGPSGQSMQVSIRVYDVSGKEIATLLNESLEIGDHSLKLNIDQFSKGVYMVQMISDAGIENQKLIVQ